MTDEPEDPNRPHNLWEPLPGDHGARGRFDAQARDTDWYTEANLHRSRVVSVGALLAGAAVVMAAIALVSRRETPSS
jgi:hypothetical protein